MPSNLNLTTRWPSLVQLRPVDRPTVGREFFQVPAWKRSLISILYCILCLEHWIAPSGFIRGWFRLNSCVAVVVGTAILLVGPVITILLHNLYDWSHMIVQILIKLMSMLSVLPPLVLTVISSLVLWKLFQRHRRGNQLRSNSHPNYYE